MAVVKKPVSRNKKSQKKPFFETTWFFKLVICTFILVFLYSQRSFFTYYLGFKTSKVWQNARTTPLEKILDNHIEKSFGVDVSEYQSTINWQNGIEINGGYPIDYVFIRATAGANKTDKKFKQNWLACRKTKLFQGAYHYYRPNENSIEQANNFIKNVTLQKGDFPPILDIEKLPKTQSISKFKLGLKRWLDRVEAHYGVKPIIYSGESYYEDFLKDDFSDYDFWIANYTQVYNTINSNWLFWQFTETGKVRGIRGSVDLNIFNGNLSELEKILID